MNQNNYWNNKHDDNCTQNSSQTLAWQPTQSSCMQFWDMCWTPELQTEPFTLTKQMILTFPCNMYSHDNFWHECLITFGTKSFLAGKRKPEDVNPSIVNSGTKKRCTLVPASRWYKSEGGYRGSKTFTSSLLGGLIWSVLGFKMIQIWTHEVNPLRVKGFKISQFLTHEFMSWTRWEEFLTNCCKNKVSKCVETRSLILIAILILLLRIWMFQILSIFLTNVGTHGFIHVLSRIKDLNVKVHRAYHHAARRSFWDFAGLP